MPEDKNIKDDNIKQAGGEIPKEDIPAPEKLANGESEASLSGGYENATLKEMLDTNFIEYASYVIKERAIPDVDDGLKPVQRRILWSLFRMHDGKFHKVANVIGHTMQFHPHGDASIGEALVVLANKEYYIEKQGNFGNILTGDRASAARYIECRLSPLAWEVLFNSDITEFADSYDGRNREPVTLPVKVPSLLMGGADGIAVGMATHILPHNFNELLLAQIAVLKNEEFEIYPDFLQGGTMDVREYQQGNGRVKIRAKIDTEGRKLIIREVPATTTTESLITSIEKASEKNKIKIASINDYTAENVEIEITPMRGQDPKKTLKALYAYTDCSVSVNVNLMVICDNAPVQMTVNEVLRRNTGKLLTYLKRELEIELEKLNIRFHEKTLAQIFIENRIYKRIEKCETYELVFSEVRAGLEKFKDKLKHEITNENIEKLLEIRIKRISLFDINKNQKEIKDILAQIKIVERNLKNLKEFAINYIMDLINKYGKFFPRKTEIEKLDKIDITKVALNNIKVGWDRKNSYIGTNIKSDEQITCNEFDKLLCVTRNGKYKVINIPDKLFCGKLFDFRKYDSKTEFGVVYTEKKTGKIYAKRTVISKYITDKEYTICPDGCRLEVITPRPNSVYECVVNARIKDKREFELNLMEMPQRTPRARGKLVNVNKLKKISFIRLLEEPENSREEPPEKIEEKTKSTPATEASPEPVPETQQKNPQQKEKKETRKKKEPSAKEIEETRQKSKRGKTPVAPEPKPENNRENDKDENSDDEDWGISQPELGF